MKAVKGLLLGLSGVTPLSERHSGVISGESKYGSSLIDMVERVTVPVVMDSEIQGLPDLRGYFVQQDKVVKFGFKPLPRRVKAEALIERTITSFEWRPADAEDVDQGPEAAAVRSGGRANDSGSGTARAGP